MIAGAFLLTLGARQSKLGTVIDDPARLGIGLLLAATTIITTFIAVVGAGLEPGGVAPVIVAVVTA